MSRYLVDIFNCKPRLAQKVDVSPEDIARRDGYGKLNGSCLMLDGEWMISIRKFRSGNNGLIVVKYTGTTKVPQRLYKFTIADGQLSLEASNDVVNCSFNPACLERELESRFGISSRVGVMPSSADCEKWQTTKLTPSGLLKSRVLSDKLGSCEASWVVRCGVGSVGETEQLFAALFTEASNIWLLMPEFRRYLQERGWDTFLDCLRHPCS